MPSFYIGYPNSSSGSSSSSDDLADLNDDSDHRLVTDDQIDSWDKKLDEHQDISMKLDKSEFEDRVKTDVPENAVFTDTIYEKPESEPISYIDGLDKRLSDIENSEALPSVDTYDDLPDANDYDNKHFLVNTTTGVIGFRKLSGIYLSEDGEWRRISKNQLTSYDSDMLDGEHKDFFLDRANHTGTQDIDSIDGLSDELDKKLDKSDYIENIPNKSYIQTFTSGVDIDSGDATLLNTFDEITIQKNKKIQVDYYVPFKFNTSISSDDYCGIYIQINCKVNDTWYNLGNAGIEEFYINDDANNSNTYRNFLNIDFIDILDLADDEDYTVQFELTARTTAGTATINDDHDINSTDNDLNSRGDLLDIVSKQQYCHINIAEKSR